MTHKSEKIILLTTTSSSAPTVEDSTKIKFNGEKHNPNRKQKQDIKGQQRHRSILSPYPFPNRRRLFRPSNQRSPSPRRKILN